MNVSVAYSSTLFIFFFASLGHERLNEPNHAHSLAYYLSKILRNPILFLRFV